MNLSLCKAVITNEEKQQPCNHSINGKFTTNLKYHLKNHHRKEYAELTELEAKEKKKKEDEKLSAVSSACGKSVFQKQLKLPEALKTQPLNTKP